MNEVLRETYAQQLADFSSRVDKEVTLIQQGVRAIRKSEDADTLQQLKQQLNTVLENIALSGDTSAYEWTHLRSLIVVKTRDVLLQMEKNYPYVKYPGINEGFEDGLDVILQFLCFFDQKPPFTIQRICELLLNPEKHYKSSKKILSAMEKLVNVNQI